MVRKINKTNQLNNATSTEKIERTVVGHVEGGETDVSVAKHGFNGVVSINSAPTSTGLPHAVKDSTYFERIVPVLHRD